MMIPHAARRLTAIGSTIVLTLTGCGFDGINSLPLPGAVGRGPNSTVYHVEIVNVGTLEPNSPVMIDDVVVGSVGAMRLDNWHADVEVSVRPGVTVPANAVATVGQTSLLGSMHLALDPPLGQAAEGRLPAGATIPLSASSAYPSTEQTLSALSTVVNAGGLGQIGDIVHSFSAALAGNEGRARDLLARLDTFVGTLDGQRDNVVAAIRALDRLAATLRAQSGVISQSLRDIPAALDVLLKERPRFTAALKELGTFSDTARGAITDTQADLVRNLDNLGPTVRALADVGPDIDTALAFLPVYPFGQTLIDRGIRGDYMNLFVTIDLTKNRLKRGLLAGTRWGDEDVPLVPAPGDPGYDDFYTTNPLGAPVAPPPPADPNARVPMPPGLAAAPPPGRPPVSAGSPGGPGGGG